MKHERWLLFAGTAVLLLGLWTGPAGTGALACSTVKLQHGKELLYGHNLNANGMDVPGMVFVNKRGVFKTGRSWSELIRKDQANPSSLRWISRYGSVTFNTFGQDLPDGGVNEAGLYVWEMGLGGEEIVYPKDPKLPKLNQMHWMQYVLDNCSTVEEALGCARGIEIDGWGWHFFVGDRNGNCAAIDFLDGQVVVNQGPDMPVPGLFNTPYARDRELARYFRGFGGCYEPRLEDKGVPRYVKTAVMLEEYEPRLDAVAYGFRILDNIFVHEVADWSVLVDVRRQAVHFKTSRNPAVKTFSLSKLNYSNLSPALILEMEIPEPGSVDGRFSPFTREAMAKLLADLKLPAAFCEVGGLKTEELLKRLTGHTLLAQTAETQTFAGRWSAEPEAPGKAPQWDLRLSVRGDAVAGEISNSQGALAQVPLEHIHMQGNRLVFTFRHPENGEILEGTARWEGDKMTLQLWDIQCDRGRFELTRRP